jgi:hypothetical protein
MKSAFIALIVLFGTMAFAETEKLSPTDKCLELRAAAAEKAQDTAMYMAQLTDESELDFMTEVLRAQQTFALKLSELCPTKDE